MNLEEMKEQKKQKGFSCEQIADWSGVPLGTVQKIFSGITQSPRYSTLQALEKVFRSHEPKEKLYDYSEAEKYGNFQNYLNKALHITPEEQAKFRDMYLE